MASTTEISLAQQIEFYASIVGTKGMAEENVKLANKNVFRLLTAIEPFVGDYVDEANDLMEERTKDRERAGKSILEPTEADFSNLKILKD